MSSMIQFRFRPIKTLLLLLVLGMLLPGSADCCFGPKLFIGADGTPRQQTFYALVSIYLKEKTGTESKVVRAGGVPPQALLDSDKADLVFHEGTGRTGSVVFAKQGMPVILSGDRPQNDLQFTLVLPALKKLSGLLQADDFASLVSAVASGRPPLATARDFLDQQGWL